MDSNRDGFFNRIGRDLTRVRCSCRPELQFAVEMQFSQARDRGSELRGLFSGYPCAANEALVSIAASALRALPESST